MTEDELQQYIESKREARAGRFGSISHVDAVALAATVLIQVREECAKICDDIERKKWETIRDGGKLEGFSARDCAAAIRAMK